MFSGSFEEEMNVEAIGMFGLWLIRRREDRSARYVCFVVGLKKRRR